MYSENRHKPTIDETHIHRSTIHPIGLWDAARRAANGESCGKKEESGGQLIKMKSGWKSIMFWCVSYAVSRFRCTPRAAHATYIYPVKMWCGRWRSTRASFRHAVARTSKVYMLWTAAAAWHTQPSRTATAIHFGCVAALVSMDIMFIPFRVFFLSLFFPVIFCCSRFSCWSTV